MNKQAVIELMQSSKSPQEWDANADAVQAEFGGQYPDFWWTEIVKIYPSVSAGWKEQA